MAENEAKDGECHFYLIKKRRYCRFRPKPGQQYCPEHACIMGVQSGRKRVPCPLNPSHNCYEDELEKHLKKCNVTKIQQATERASYFVKGINRGITESEAKEPAAQSVCVKELTSKDLASMIAKVNKLYEDHVEKLETAIYEHPCVREEFCTSEQEDLSEAFKEQAALRKELLQQASLLGQLEKQGLLSDGHCFVEMGAGKGKLSHWIQKASKDSVNNSFLLVEKSSVRYKMDTFHKLAGDVSTYNRIKIDIGDLCLGRIPEVNCKDSVIVIGKHLCGGATDMGIRCAMETLGIQGKLCPGSTVNATVPSSSSSSGLSHSSERTLASESLPSEKPLSPSINSGEAWKNSQTSASSKDKSESLLDSKTADMSSIGTSSSIISCPLQLSVKSLNDKKSQQGVPDHNQSEIIQGTVKDQSVCHPGSANNNICGEAENDKKKERSSESDDFQEPPTKTQKLMQNEEKAETNERLPEGIMIALCCHHQCTWDTYLGKEFMRSCDVSPKEFDLLTRLSCWATCAKVTAKSIRKGRADLRDTSPSPESTLAELDREKPDSGDRAEKGNVAKEDKLEDHDTADRMNFQEGQHLREQLSVVEREEIGRKCKRLIDAGRLHYLRSKGMECVLREYINEDITPENIVLIAYPKS